PEMFDQQLGWFKGQGYQTITLPQLYAFMTGRPIPPAPPTKSRPTITWPWRLEPQSAPLPAKALVITFDDGYESNYVYAYPALRKYGFHASIELITSTVHDGPAAPFDPAVLTYLNWDEVQEMARSGLVDFQSHTDNLHQTGPDGTPLTLSLPAPEVLADLTRANQIIETKTGQQVLALAYPYGRYTQELERLAHEAGYKLGFTITEGFTRPLENALAVKRFILFMDDTPGRLAERFPDH
ncbi:MAG: polysaccharide deacetylase family protein, partial [Bacillota bacterium]